MENQIFILRTPAAINFFHQILKNCHFGVRKKSFLTHMDLYDPYMSKNDFGIILQTLTHP